MPHKERELSILSYLKEHGETDVPTLCRALYVSAPTMRRDLAALNAAGKIIRTHGGAAPRSVQGENLPQTYREREHAAAKQCIGQKCLSLLREGDTVMVDGSSTGEALLRALGTRQSLLVITNHAKAPLLLGEGKVRLFVTGGETAPHTYAYVGSHAEAFLRSFYADICFFSVRTLTAQGELTDNAIAENAVRRVMLAQARRRVLMLDSEKLGAPCIHRLCTLAEIDDVVCEREIAAGFSHFSTHFL